MPLSANSISDWSPGTEYAVVVLVLHAIRLSDVSFRWSDNFPPGGLAKSAGTGGHRRPKMATPRNLGPSNLGFSLVLR
jgi:hypothetical protein